MSNCGTYQSTYQQHYKSIPVQNFAVKAKKISQQDEALLSGQFHNNLQVNGVQKKSKVWPATAVGIEEYRDYVKRLECCQKEIYKLYYDCDTANTSNVIEKMLKDLEKSTYQVVYSPNEFVSRKEAHRFKKIIAPHDFNKKSYATTTYDAYYNRVIDLQIFKNILYGRLPVAQKEILRNELKQIYKFGKTTYHWDICLPTMELSKMKSFKTGAPIDRYTLRKI